MHRKSKWLTNPWGEFAYFCAVLKIQFYYNNNENCILRRKVQKQTQRRRSLYIGILSHVAEAFPFARQGTILNSHRVIGINCYQYLNGAKLCLSDLHNDDSRCRTGECSSSRVILIGYILVGYSNLLGYNINIKSVGFNINKLYGANRTHDYSLSLISHKKLVNIFIYYYWPWDLFGLLANRIPYLAMLCWFFVTTKNSFSTFL